MTLPTFPTPQGQRASPCSIHALNKPLETLLKSFQDTLRASANTSANTGKRLEVILLDLQQQCQRNSEILQQRIHAQFNTITNELREAKEIISKSVHDVLSRDDRLKRDDIAAIVDAALQSAKDSWVELQPHCCANLNDMVQNVVETKLQEQRQQNILLAVQETTKATPAEEERLTVERHTEPRRKKRKQKTIVSVTAPSSSKWQWY
jgi:hypothetical protein